MQNPISHLAIIMDGNGRWAQRQGLSRLKGHEMGARAAKRVVELAKARSIRYLTLYAFSSENWSRPKEEVEGLFRLLERFIAEEVDRLKSSGICIHVIGDLSRFSDHLQDTIRRTLDETKDNQQLHLAIALNYGGRDEILRCAGSSWPTVPGRRHHREIFSGHLDTAFMPDRTPDPHGRRMAYQQLLAVAARLHRDLLHGHPLARLRREGPGRGDLLVQGQAAAVRHDRRAGRGETQMTRIFGALILIVIFALPAIFGPAWVLALLAMLVVPVCMYELFRVALGTGARVLGWIAMVSSTPFLYFAYRGDAAWCFMTVGVTSVVLMIVSLFLYEKNKGGARDLVYAIAGLFYPMALIGFWVLLRVAPDGRFWMIFGLVSVFASDVGAYYVGKNLGRHHLAPRLSPKKTVEGFIGGIGLAVMLGYATYLIYSAVTAHYQVETLTGAYPVWLLAVLSACIAVLDLAGDLTASLFKREFQIKDLGNLIPGHGGMLDRMDGIIPVGCLLYFVLKVFG